MAKPTKPITGPQEPRTIAELFGAEHIDTLSKISGNYDEFVKIIKMGNSEAAKGSMAKEFTIMSKTAERQLEGVKAAIARSAVGMSDVLMPSVLSTAQGLQSLMEKVQKFSSEYPSLTKFIVGGSAGFIAFGIAAGALGWAVSSAIIPFVKFYGWATKVELMSKLAAGATKAWTAAQWLFNAALSMNPIGLTILAIAGLIAIGVALYKNWDLVTNKASELGTGITNAFKSAANNVIPIINRIIGVLNKIPGVNIAQIELYKITQASSFGALRAMDTYASGGFANRPSIFGEASPEVAIPMDGSIRSISLWEQAGRMLGVSNGGHSNIIVNYSPTINAPGGAPGIIRQALKEAKDDLMADLKAIARQERRLSYA